MAVRNCKRCGKMYNALPGKNACEACLKKEEADFEIARAYVKENPGCNMQMVADNTEVPLKLLAKFVREKRIEFVDGTESVFLCESCGTPVSSGRYCNSCLAKLGQQLVKDSKPKPAPREVGKKEQGMHLSRFK